MLNKITQLTTSDEAECFPAMVYASEFASNSRISTMMRPARGMCQRHSHLLAFHVQADSGVLGSDQPDLASLPSYGHKSSHTIYLPQQTRCSQQTNPGSDLCLSTWSGNGGPSGRSYVESAGELRNLWIGDGYGLGEMKSVEGNVQVTQ